MVVDHTRAAMTAALSFPDGFPAARAPRSGRTVTRTLLALVLACSAACASGPKKPPVGTLEPDKFLWERGSDQLNQKHWLTSREYFRQLMDSYPQSSYRADAKLGMGDTYLGEGSAESRVLAVNEYREFLSFYPTHRRADYAQFKLGMAHFYEMHGPERDQTETREAIAELSLFVQKYPVACGTSVIITGCSDLLAEVRGRLREAHDRLSDANYRVAYFYLKTGRFPPAAIDRFNAILKEDPEYTRRDAVYFFLAQALIKVQRPAEALPYLDRLAAEFEQSEYLEEARKLAVTLKDEQTKKAKNGSMSP
ncbi:MAG: outer membrane protein assembly factor BamD [Acidobacteriota bacterium]